MEDLVTVSGLVNFVVIVLVAAVGYFLRNLITQIKELTLTLQELKNELVVNTTTIKHQETQIKAIWGKIEKLEERIV